MARTSSRRALTGTTFTLAPRRERVGDAAEAHRSVRGDVHRLAAEVTADARFPHVSLHHEHHVGVQRLALGVDGPERATHQWRLHADADAVGEQHRGQRFAGRHPRVADLRGCGAGTARLDHRVDRVAPPVEQ